MNTRKEIFQRTERLVGTDMMQRLADVRVILFGVGGVGSWCAESLIRSGIGHLTIVDSDRIGISNINRQLMATTSTIGQVKVEVLKQRLLDINPEADIVALQQIYTQDTCDTFHIDEYDYILDAIDSLENKVLLIRKACETPAVLFSSMGAALKLDPLKIDVAEFWKVKGCPLAAALRRKFKKSKELPRKKFKCVYSDELMPNLGPDEELEASLPLEDAPGDPALAHHDWSASKAQINGTLAHTTAIFGLTLAGLVIQDLWKKNNAPLPQ